MYKMTHYAQRIERDGAIEIHITNAVGGFIGQHHVHTENEFANWKPIGEVKWLKTHTECDCGLNPGEMKSGL